MENRIQGDSSPSSVTTHYIYDTMGNLRYKQNHPTSPTIVESYEYDARGLMLTAKKGTEADDGSISSVAMTYNGLGYMETSSQSIKGGTAKEVSYLRDQLGQMTQLTIPASTPVVLNYAYTSLGQIDTIKRSGVELVNYSYKGTFVTGRSYLQAGINPIDVPDYEDEYDDYKYDNFGRLSKIKVLNGSNQGVDFLYPLYDANGNIESQTYKHRSSTTTNGFDYDPLNRLIEADYLAGTAGSELFNYDLLGNREDSNGYSGYKDTRPAPDVTCSYGNHENEENKGHNPANEYDKIGGVGVLYDAAGNLIQDKAGYKYAYDYENRLTQITRQDNTVVATFEYDALGRRIEKKDMLTGIAKRYYYDDHRIVLQTTIPSGGSQSDEKYFIFGNYIDEVLLMHTLAGTYTGDFYYGHDHLYSPTVLFGLNEQQSWEPCERYEYDVYGSVRILSTNYDLRTTSSYANPYTFTGRELDSMDGGSCKLMYYRARSYDPQTGRFLQRDPLGVNPAGGRINRFNPTRQYKDGMNIYEYVRSNTINKSDPHGLYWPKDPCDDVIVNIQIRMVQVVAAGTILMGPGAAKDAFPHYPNDWPHQHCVWNCRMARGGRNAEWASAVKEAMDEAIADLRDELLESGCYDHATDFLKINLEGPACSASQPSDFRDNATGGKCKDVCWKTTCEECCANFGVPSGTPEGPGTDRPYGPRCKFPELLQ